MHIHTILAAAIIAASAASACLAGFAAVYGPTTRPVGPVFRPGPVLEPLASSDTAADPDALVVAGADLVQLAPDGTPLYAISIYPPSIARAGRIGGRDVGSARWMAGSVTPHRGDLQDTANDTTPQPQPVYFVDDSLTVGVVHAWSESGPPMTHRANYTRADPWGSLSGGIVRTGSVNPWTVTDSPTVPLADGALHAGNGLRAGQLVVAGTGAYSLTTRIGGPIVRRAGYPRPTAPAPSGPGNRVPAGASNPFVTHSTLAMPFSIHPTFPDTESDERFALDVGVVLGLLAVAALGVGVIARHALARG